MFHPDTLADREVELSLRRHLPSVSLFLLVTAAACMVAYRSIGTWVDAEGILREPFALVPIGWLCLMLAALIGGIHLVRTWRVRSRPGAPCA